MRLSATLLAAVLVLSAGCAGDEASAPQSPAERGARLYAMHCASCHQRDGRGLGDIQPSLAGSATATGDPQGLIAWVLLGRRPATLAEGRSAVVMPPFAWLSDEDLALVLTHVRTSFGNAASAVTAAEVATVRADGAQQ